VRFRGRTCGFAVEAGRSEATDSVSLHVTKLAEPPSVPAASRGLVSGSAGGLAVELASEFRHLWPTCVPGFFKDRRDIGVGEEALPTLRIPVEEHPDPALLIGIAKGLRTLGPMLLSLLKACGCEDTPPTVEILDLRRRQKQLSPPLWEVSSRTCDLARDYRAPHVLVLIQAGGRSPVAGDEPSLAAHLRIEEHELQTGGRKGSMRR
jgi:hypothetical protein